MRTTRRDRRGRLLTAAAAGAAFLVATAPALAAADSEPSQDSTMVVGWTAEIDSMNPFVSGYSAATEMFELIYDSLTAYSPEDLSPQPGIATEWETSADGLTWTFTIRDDAKFHDGEPLTAQDVAYTFNRILEGETEKQKYGGHVLNWESVTAPDDTTVVIKTKVPTSTMLGIDIPIIPEHTWEQIPLAETADFANTEDVIGSGPFRLVEYKADQVLRFEANKDYWGGAPHIDGLIFQFYKNTDAAVQALKKGEVDLVNQLTPVQFDTLQNAQNIATVQGSGAKLRELGMNMTGRDAANQPFGDGHPALQDPQVRLAIHHAIDKETLVENVLGGYGTPGTSLIPPMFKTWHWEPSPDEMVTFDLNRANEILDQAGYARGADGIRVSPDGRKLQFRLFGRSSDEPSVRAVEYIEGWLKEIGIAVERTNIESTVLGDRSDNGQFDLFEWGWTGDPDPDYLLNSQTCGQRPQPDGSGGHIGQHNDAMYCNADYDRLYEQQAQAVDPDERQRLVHEMQRIHYNDHAYAVLYYLDLLEAYRTDKFTDFQLQPADGGSITYQAGSWSYLSVRPVNEAEQAGSGGIDGTTVAAIAAVAAVALVGGGFFAMRRRQAGAEDRE